MGAGRRRSPRELAPIVVLAPAESPATEFLNAFVCRQDAVSLSLTPEHDCAELDVATMVESVCAVIVSVYDAESFLVGR